MKGNLPCPYYTLQRTITAGQVHSDALWRASSHVLIAGFQLDFFHLAGKEDGGRLPSRTHPSHAQGESPWEPPRLRRLRARLREPRPSPARPEPPVPRRPARMPSRSAPPRPRRAWRPARVPLPRRTSAPTLGDGRASVSRERPFRVLSGFLGAGFSRHPFSQPCFADPAPTMLRFPPVTRLSGLRFAAVPCRSLADVRCLCSPVPVQAAVGLAPHSPAVATSFICHAFQRLLARRFAARRKASPVSSGADVDPFGNVYFSRRVLTHVRLPLRILPRVLRRFARPRSTARNPRKDAPRL